MGILLLKYIIGYIAIGLAVIIHETGHLIAAKLTKIDVEVFSFGIGPRITGTMVGNTEVRLSLLPFGGYCKMKGTDDLNRAIKNRERKFSSLESGSLFAASPLARLITFSAGPLFNLLFASLIYAILALFPTAHLSTPATVATVDSYPELFHSDSPAGIQGIRTDDRILRFDQTDITDYQHLEKLLMEHNTSSHTFTVQRGKEVLSFEVSPQDGRWGLTNCIEPVVGLVRNASPEQKAGLLKGDRILRCNNKEIKNNLDLLTALKESRKVYLEVEREGQRVPINFTAKSHEDGSGNFQFSLASGKRIIEAPPFSLFRGTRQAIHILKNSCATLINILAGRESDVRQQLTGTNRAALMIGDIAELGFSSSLKTGLRGLAYLAGIVSISLAIGNILPLPAFDGGHIILSLVEIITRRQTSPRMWYTLQILGLIAIFIIIALLTFVDLRYLYLVKFKK